MQTRLVALLIALLLAVPASAAPSADTVQAKRLFQSGTKHYNLREYEQALADFREAYRLREDGVFLYNIAQCYRMLENQAEAASFYRNYLRTVPDAPNRTEVEQRIAALEQQIAEEKAKAEAEQRARAEAEERARAEAAAAAAAAAQSNAVVAAAPRKQPLYKRWWLWTAVGGAVVVGVGLGVGLGLGLRHDAPGTFPSVDLTR